MLLCGDEPADSLAVTPADLAGHPEFSPRGLL